MGMLNWDESAIELEQADDFIDAAADRVVRGHKQGAKYCMLNDQDCEACQ